MSGLLDALKTLWRRKSTTAKLQSSFQPWQPGQGNSGVFSQEEEGICSCGLARITCDLGPV